MNAPKTTVSSSCRGRRDCYFLEIPGSLGVCIWKRIYHILETKMISPGSKLPDFKLQNQDGKWLSRDDFKGQWLVLYAYPKDDTPGCTVQGKSFTATRDEFTALGAVVLGISEDDVTSHKAFCNKFSFTVDLLADTDKTLLRSLGIGQTDWNGTLYWDRTTVISDPSGIVRKVYEKVKPAEHELLLLNDLKELQGKKS